MYTGTAKKVLEALEGYGLKEDRPGHYRSNSPLRPGSNSHGFTLVIHDSEHGAFFDHVSQEQGSLYYLAKELGIETPENTAPANTKRIYSGIEDYATAHGITASALKNAGWYETVYQNRRALAFKTSTGTRWRFLDDQKPHYKSEVNYSRCWYGLTPSLVMLLGQGKPLIIANGEVSTVAARQYGLGAACVTGGEKALPPDLIEELKVFLGGTEGEHVPPIIVAFDCDSTGQQAARLVTKQLHAAGFTAKAVNLGLGGKGDLADFCMLHGKNTPRALNQLPAMALDEPPVSHEPRGWYIIHADELDNLPPIEWIVPGEIPARGITVLFGASGAGKSFVALDYALKIAQEQPVLYMAGEGEYGYQQRVKAWCSHHMKPRGKLYMCIGAVQLLESGDLDAFLALNQPINPVIVIIDTMARSMVGSDENSTRDMGLFVQACEKVKQTLDCAVMVIHHTNKGGIQERGNSALRGASDVMIKLTAEDDIIRIESAKTKDAQPFPMRYMQLLTVKIEINEETVESAVIIEADKVLQTADDPLTPNQEKVLRLLCDEPHGATRTEIANATGVPYFSLQRILTQLLKLEYIEISGYGQPYKVTQAGIDRHDRLDHPFSEGEQSSPEKDRRSSRSTDHLREKQTDLDRTTSGDHASNTDKNSDHASESGDHPDQTQLRLIGTEANNYYEAGL